jgi:C2 domain
LLLQRHQPSHHQNKKENQRHDLLLPLQLATSLAIWQLPHLSYFRLKQSPPLFIVYNMNFDLNEELLEPRDSSETDNSDFQVPTQLTPWEDVDEGIHLVSDDPYTSVTVKNNNHNAISGDAAAFNTHGVVHVRLLCAQRLPCPVGSSVCASVSLPPYKGRVKSKRKNAFLVSLDHGVCVQWNQIPKDHGNFIDQDDDDGLCSMVNGWSSKDSPVPSIRIDLMFSPLGMGLFDFTMATVELSCAVLLKNAGVWRERWLQMEIPSTLQSGSGIDNSSNAYFHRVPLVKIQAIFTPSAPSGGESSVGMFGFGSSTSRVPQQVPPPLIKSQAKPVIVVPDASQTGMAITSTASSQSGERMPLERRNSDETLSLSALDGIKSKKIMRESHEKREKGTIHEEEDATEADEDMTSIGMESDFRLDSPMSERGAADDGSIVSKSVQTPAALDPHLLRADTYWVPGSCAVCERVLIGRNGGFHCEQCGIDCCGDCRLNVDIRVPCGSDAAQEFVEKIQKAKLSLSGLLNYVAPDEAFEQKRIGEESMHQSRHNPSETVHTGNSHEKATSDSPGETPPIGCFRVDVVKACLFQQNLPAWEEIPYDAYESDGTGKSSSKPPVRKGDYYVRVSTTDSNKTLRTPTLQNTGMPHFQSSEMTFPLPHYGVQFRIDVVEANTDSIVGSSLLTTQGLLQEQRDSFIETNGASLLQFLKGPVPWLGKRTFKLELRAGIKVGAIDDFYTAPKGGADQTGAISGWIQIDAGIEEFNKKLYGSRPIECPNRPPADLNIGNFSVHIARIKAIIEDLNDVVAEYNYVVSWKNPFLTAISFYVFVWFCLSFNAEYSGSLPLLILLLLSSYCAYKRSRGNAKKRYIQEELESIQRVEGSSVAYTLHRPKGTLNVAVTKGRSLLSKDLGISGRVSCGVFFDQMRYADKKTRDKVSRADKSATTPLEIGITPTIYSAHPDWNEMVESTTSKRLKQLIPGSDQDFFNESTSSEDTTEIVRLRELSFPVLQPFEVSSSVKDGKGRFVDGSLIPWHNSKGAVVVQVKFQDFFNNLPGFDHSLGEVVFPFAELVKNRQVKGWFKILEVGTNLIVPLDDLDLDGEQLDGNTGPPRVYLHLKWTPPSDSLGTKTEEGEKELSYVIQEELVRSSVLSKENKFDLVGSSIGAVNTALGIGGTVQVIQNTLGSVLDVLEAIINAFNFTDPFKSSVIFAGLFLVWLVLAMIPTRYIVLAGGLAQYAVTFALRFGEDLGISSTKKKSSKATDETKVGGTPSPFAIWINNAIRSLPTNEDLRKAYFWESRRLGAEQAEKHASEKRESRLKKLWKASWYSSVNLLFHEEEGDGQRFYKEPCFAVIQGHKFLWWYSVQDFDNGEPPDGKLFLSGHAGLGGPSPLEMRELSPEELPLCLSIFGRGGGGQQKVVMILPNSNTREALENAVAESFSFKTD